MPLPSLARSRAGGTCWRVRRRRKDAVLAGIGEGSLSTVEAAEAAIERGLDARRDKRPDDARAAFAEAADIFQSLGLKAQLAETRTRQAQIERDTRNFAEAFAFQSDAIALERPLGAPRTLAHMLRHAGDILQDWGRHADADPYYDEMIALYKSLADIPPLELANALRSVALHTGFMGERQKSIELWRDVRNRYAALDDQFLALTGVRENPGVKEADRRLAALGA
jgi:tetratricopeptide (TPR) repeat protein